MSHRTQITLADEQYERLRAESRRSGIGLAELVRRAVDRTYGTSTADDVERALDASFGVWTARDYDGAGYVDRLRRGMSRRLAS
jgi:Ribbon-helix-helix domain